MRWLPPAPRAALQANLVSDETAVHRSTRAPLRAGPICLLIPQALCHSCVGLIGSDLDFEDE